MSKPAAACDFCGQQIYGTSVATGRGVRYCYSCAALAVAEFHRRHRAAERTDDGQE